MTDRQTVSSGTKWEAMAGYSRAIRYGNHVFVAGTTATDSEGNIVGEDDPAEQTRFILSKIEAALIEAGASLKDVVRTRIYVVNIDEWEPVARVHGEVFAAVRPANTLLAIDALVGPGYLVEIEADAIIGAGHC
ncbi:MAG: RidA family protein [Chloroflexota bacterium]